HVIDAGRSDRSAKSTDAATGKGSVGRTLAVSSDRAVAEADRRLAPLRTRQRLHTARLSVRGTQITVHASVASRPSTKSDKTKSAISPSQGSESRTTDIRMTSGV